MSLSGADRRHLRRLAHPLRPVVQIGAGGLTDRVVEAIDRALADHELIKLKIADEREARRDLAADVAARTGSELAGVVGRVAILYRPAPEHESRAIVLPSSRGPAAGGGA